MSLFREEKVEIRNEISLAVCSKVKLRFNSNVSMQVALL
jgi:hypothetical protein